MKTAAKVIALTMIAIAFVGADAKGETISGTLSSPTLQSVYDISTNTTDWIYYSYNSATSTYAQKANGPASFSALSNTDGAGHDSYIYLSYANGTTTGGSAVSSSLNQGFSTTHNIGGSMSLTHTLIASSETLTFYLVAYKSTENILATLGSTTYSLSAVTLPATYDSGTHGYGILTLTVTGTVGETLTLSLTPLTSGGNIGIQAATVVVSVPEPHAMAIFVSGLIGLLAFAWRKRRK